MPAVQDTPVSQAAQSVPTSQGASTPMSASMPVDPQQPLREYVSPRAGMPPVAGAYQPVAPAYSGQPGVTPSACPGYPPYATQPGYPAPTQPGYVAPKPGQVSYGVPAQPGYGTSTYINHYGVPAPAQSGHSAPMTPYPGYPAPVFAPAGYGVPGYTYPGYGVPASYPGYNVPGYAYYPGYGYYPWPMAAPRPKRDGYQLAVAIIALVCSGLAILLGLFSLIVVLLVAFIPNPQATPDQIFGGLIVFLALAIVGVGGGGFCTYHCIRSLLKKTSRNIWLPYFWIFLLCYGAALGLGFWLNAQGPDSISPQLKGLLIYLSALLPALAVLSLGIRRLCFSLRDQWLAFWRRLLLMLHLYHASLPLAERWSAFGQRASGKLNNIVGSLPAVGEGFQRRAQKRLAQAAAGRARSGQWPTSWRRLVLALVSGATLSVLLAGILEFVIQVILVGSQGAAFSRALNDPNFSPPPSLYAILLIMLAVVAPLVEEMVKPLAVVILIGRVKSKAEAFALGLACGIGFNLVETTGYISSGTGSDWLNIALIRSGAGLLHGFGAAMVALGWYILTHKEEGSWPRRIWLSISCALYAMIQHAAWNGSVGLLLIPGPVGNFFQNGSWTLGVLTIHAYEFVNLVELFVMLILFIYIAGRLRDRPVV